MDHTHFEGPVTEFIFHLIDNQKVLNFLLKNHICVIISYILYAIAMDVVLKTDWKCQAQSRKVGAESYRNWEKENDSLGSNSGNGIYRDH